MTATQLNNPGSLIVAVIVLLVGTASLPAYSAAPGPDGNRGHLNRLLHNEKVMDHLGLTEKQSSKAQAISDEVVENHRAAFENALQPETMAERVPLVARVFRSVNADTFERLEDVLSEAQHKRLKQIEIQTFGVRAFGRPSVIEYLDITPPQQQDLNAVGDEMGRQLSGLHQSSTLSDDEKQRQGLKIRLTALQEAREVLGATQWVRWELLTGAEFRR
jgi:hypothetical protein